MKTTNINWNNVAWEVYRRISSDLNNKSTCSEGFWISRSNLKDLIKEVVSDLGYVSKESIVASILLRHIDEISGLSIEVSMRKRVLPNFNKPKYWRGYIISNTTIKL